jgi:hypothetical protein
MDFKYVGWRAMNSIEGGPQIQSGRCAEKNGRWCKCVLTAITALHFAYCNDISPLFQQYDTRNSVYTEHLKTVVVKIVDFLDVTLFRLVSRYRRLRITCSFHL